MPPTSDDASVLIDGLDRFDLEDLEADLVRAATEAIAAQTLCEAGAAEISVCLVDDAEISELNARWLERSGPTDVISFGLGEAPLVADIYVSVDTAGRNAERYGVHSREELIRLVVHGVLHAVGYDHPEGEERSTSEMFALQEGVVARLLGDGPDS